MDKKPTTLFATDRKKFWRFEISFALLLVVDCLITSMGVSELFLRYPSRSALWGIGAILFCVAFAIGGASLLRKLIL